MSREALDGHENAVRREDSHQDATPSNGVLWVGVLLGTGLLAVAAAFAETPAGPVSTTVVGLGTLACAIGGFFAGRVTQAPGMEMESDEFADAGTTRPSAVEFSIELERSRRYGHSFTIVWVGPRSKELDLPVTARRGTRLPGSPLATAAQLETRVRSTDRVCVVRDEVYVLMPECDQTQAVRALERLDQDDPSLIGASEIRLATFPADGVTIPALLAALGLSIDAPARTWFEQAVGDG